jgi:hypothetical protein
MWQRLGVLGGVTTPIVAVSSILVPILRSDASPWASVIRVEGGAAK